MADISRRHAEEGAPLLLLADHGFQQSMHTQSAGEGEPGGLQGALCSCSLQETVNIGWNTYAEASALLPLQETDKKVNPWTKRTEWSPVGIAIYTWFIAAYVFYFYVRIAHTLTGTILG